MNRFLLPAAAAALFISFFGLGSLTLFDVDEAVFAEATKEMLESGDWITPTYNGENRYDKPILFYWLMGASYKTFGVNEFAARFPSAAAAFLMALFLFLFVRRLKDERQALYAVISLTLSVYFLVYSHAAVTDMTLTLFISLSLFSFFLSLSNSPRTGRNDKYIYGFYFFSALAFLTKGLIGILFPFGVAFLFLSITEGLSGAGKMFSLTGVILFLLVSMPWYAAQLAVNGQEFIQQFFIKHHFARYTGVISGHKGPAYYYIPVLIVGLLPWIAFLPGGIKKAFRAGKSDPDARDSRLLLFAFIWFAFIFVFFSLSTTKLPNYILPALPALSILISSGMAEPDRWNRYSGAFIALVAASMGAAFLISRKYILKFGPYDTGWTYLAAGILFAMAALVLRSAFSRKTSYGILSIVMFCFLSLLSVKAMPIVNQSLQGTLHRYSLYSGERLPAGEKIITYRINNPSILFYSGRKVLKVGDPNELAPLLQQEKNLLLISKAKEIGALNNLGFNLIEEDGKYAILERPEFPRR